MVGMFGNERGQPSFAGAASVSKIPLHIPQFKVYCDVNNAAMRENQPR